MLDVNKDGAISRSDLQTAAKRMRWHWDEAPIFALLDLLTVPNPIRKKQFTAYMQQVADDPMGLYGKVLIDSMHNSSDGIRIKMLRIYSLTFPANLHYRALHFQL